MATYNLLDENWLPCGMAEEPGVIRYLSIREALFSAGTIRELVGENPLQTLSLHRLLIALLHRALNGPEDAAAWNEIYSDGAFDPGALDNYFQKWSGRFDLFGAEYPFYQSAAAAERVQKGSIIQMYFHGKNNGTLFEQSTLLNPKKVTAAAAARLLIALQAFDFGGIKANGSAAAAPLAGTPVALAQGANLFETLVLNMYRYDGDAGHPFKFNPESDLPAWERSEDQGYSTSSAGMRVPDGYCDLLTWQSRRVFMKPEISESGEIVVRDTVILLGDVIDRARSPNEYETMVSFITNKDGKFYPVPIKKARATWRDSISLFRSVEGKALRPRMLDWHGELTGVGYLKAETAMPIAFYGFAVDKAKPLFWRHDRFIVPRRVLRDTEMLDALASALEVSDNLGFAVKVASERMAQTINRFEPNGRFPGAIANYWSWMETEFLYFLSNLEKDPAAALSAWFKMCDKASQQTISRLANSLSAGGGAHLKGGAEAQNMLRGMRGKLIKNNPLFAAAVSTEKAVQEELI